MEHGAPLHCAHDRRPGAYPSRRRQGAHGGNAEHCRPAAASALLGPGRAGALWPLSSLDITVRSVGRLYPTVPCCAVVLYCVVSQVRVHDAFVVRYSAAGGQRSLPTHCDQSHLSFVLALNGPAEFEGGGTAFEEMARALRPFAMPGAEKFTRLVLRTVCFGPVALTVCGSGPVSAQADVGPVRPGRGCLCAFPGELMHCGEATTAGTRRAACPHHRTQKKQH